MIKSKYVAALLTILVFGSCSRGHMNEVYEHRSNNAPTPDAVVPDLASFAPTMDFAMQFGTVDFPTTGGAGSVVFIERNGDRFAEIAFDIQETNGAQVVNPVRIDDSDLDNLFIGNWVSILNSGELADQPFGYGAGSDGVYATPDEMIWRYPYRVAINKRNDLGFDIQIELGPKIDRKTGLEIDDDRIIALMSGTPFVGCAVDGVADPIFSSLAYCIEVGKRGALHLKHGTHE